MGVTFDVLFLTCAALVFVPQILLFYFLAKLWQGRDGDGDLPGVAASGGLVVDDEYVVL